jgi:hypothetical protein
MQRTQHVIYDAFGQPRFSAMPRAAATLDDVSLDPGELGTTTTVDAAGRALSVVAPDGRTTRYEYGITNEAEPRPFTRPRSRSA